MQWGNAMPLVPRTMKPRLNPAFHGVHSIPWRHTWQSMMARSGADCTAGAGVVAGSTMLVPLWWGSQAGVEAPRQPYGPSPPAHPFHRRLPCSLHVAAPLAAAERGTGSTAMPSVAPGSAAAVGGAEVDNGGEATHLQPPPFAAACPGGPGCCPKTIRPSLGTYACRQPQLPGFAAAGGPGCVTRTASYPLGTAQGKAAWVAAGRCALHPWCAPSASGQCP
jgi:hypothetical protein